MTEIFNKSKVYITNLVDKVKKRKVLRRYLKVMRQNLYGYQTSINSIDQELDLIRSGRLTVAESYIDTLLQRKLKIQQNIAEKVSDILDTEKELKKGLF